MTKLAVDGCADTELQNAYYQGGHDSSTVLYIQKKYRLLLFKIGRKQVTEVLTHLRNVVLGVPAEYCISFIVFNGRSVA